MSSAKHADAKFAAQRLRATAPLRQIADGDLQELARRAQAVAFKPGERVIAAGLGERQIIVVSQGVVAALHRLSYGERGVLTALFGRGEIAGLSSALAVAATDHATYDDEQDIEDNGAPRDFLKALTPVSGHAIAAADFMSIVRRDPDLSTALVQEMAWRMADADRLLAQTVFRPLEIRLAGFFTTIVNLASSDDWNPIVHIGRISQSLIADMLGVSREHINRTLTMWERSGLIFQSRNGGLTVQNRKRLASLAIHHREHTQPAIGDDWLWEIDAHLDCGLNQTAFHLAMEAAKRTPKDIRVRHRAVLATARSGGPRNALNVLKKLNLDKVYTDEDVACLKPRLLRDLAFLSAPEAPDKAHLTASAEGYDEVFAKCGGYYSGVNAAAGFALLGNADKAKDLSRKVSKQIEDRMASHEEDAGTYFIRASLAECALISGDKSNAAALFRDACAANDVTPGKKATTRKQLRRLAAYADIDDAWIQDAAPQGKILFFSGPLARTDADLTQQLSKLRNAFSKFLADNHIERAYGALASGADIVIAESLLAANVDLDVYLPLPPSAFIKSSVDISGGDWRDRFFACMRQAATIEWNNNAAQSSLAAFSLGAQIAMGKAVRHAEQLDSDVVSFFAAPDNRTAQNSLSVANLEVWRDRNLPFIELRDKWVKDLEGAPQEETEQILFALILEGTPDADVQFEPDNVIYKSADKSGVSILLFREVEQAFVEAKKIADKDSAGDWRLWLDAGVAELPLPKNLKFDDIREMFVMSKCLPTTETGEIYASDLFVCAARIASSKPARFEYAGFGSTREKLEPCPLYLLVR